MRIYVQEYIFIHILFQQYTDTLGTRESVKDFAYSKIT